LDFSSYYPEEVDNFGFLLQAIIGPEGTEVEESFEIKVVTPKWLGKRAAERKIFHLRHHLIVKEYDLPLIHRFINNFIERSSAETWEKAVLRLSQLGRWEFEDSKIQKAKGH